MEQLTTNYPYVVKACSKRGKSLVLNRSNDGDYTYVPHLKMFSFFKDAKEYYDQLVKRRFPSTVKIKFYKQKFVYYNHVYYPAHEIIRVCETSC